MIVPIKLKRFANPTDTIADHANDTLDYGEALFEAATGYLYISPADGTKLSALVPVNAELPAKKVNNGNVVIGMADDYDKLGIFNVNIDSGDFTSTAKNDGNTGIHNTWLIDSYINRLSAISLKNDVGTGAVIGEPIFGTLPPNEAGVTADEGKVYFRINAVG